jgi:hypothetical protein
MRGAPWTFLMAVLILGVPSICPWNHWLWSYKQKDVKFPQATWVCLCTVFWFANIRIFGFEYSTRICRTRIDSLRGFVEPESKICETNIRFVIHWCHTSVAVRYYFGLGQVFLVKEQRFWYPDSTAVAFNRFDIFIILLSISTHTTDSSFAH